MAFILGCPIFIMGKKTNRTFHVNQVVWGKVKGFSNWPCYITEIKTDSKGKEISYFVQFFGDNTMAPIKKSSIISFEKGKKMHFNKSKMPKLRNAINEAENFLANGKDNIDYNKISTDEKDNGLNLKLKDKIEKDNKDNNELDKKGDDKIPEISSGITAQVINEHIIADEKKTNKDNNAKNKGIKKTKIIAFGQKCKTLRLKTSKKKQKVSLRKIKKDKKEITKKEKEDKVEEKLHSHKKEKTKLKSNKSFKSKEKSIRNKALELESNNQKLNLKETSNLAYSTKRDKNLKSECLLQKEQIKNLNLLGQKRNKIQITKRKYKKSKRETKGTRKSVTNSTKSESYDQIDFSYIDEEDDDSKNNLIMEVTKYLNKNIIKLCNQKRLEKEKEVLIWSFNKLANYRFKYPAEFIIVILDFMNLEISFRFDYK